MSCCTTTRKPTRRQDCLTDLEWQEWALIQVAPPDEVSNKIMQEQVPVFWELSREFCQAKLRALWTVLRLIETGQGIAAPYIDTWSRSIDMVNTRQESEQKTLEKDGQKSRTALANANGQNTLKFDSLYVAVGIGNMNSHYLHTDTSTHSRDASGYWTHTHGIRTERELDSDDVWLYNVTENSTTTANNKVGEGEGHENFSHSQGATGMPTGYGLNLVANPFSEYGYIYGALADTGIWAAIDVSGISADCDTVISSSTPFSGGVTMAMFDQNFSGVAAGQLPGFSNGLFNMCEKKASNNKSQSEMQHYGFGYDRSTEVTTSTNQNSTRRNMVAVLHAETHGTIVDPITGVLSTDVWDGASSDEIHKRSDSNHAGNTHSDDLDTYHSESKLNSQATEQSEYEVQGQSTGRTDGQSSANTDMLNQSLTTFDYQQWSQWGKHLTTLWDMYYMEFEEYRRLYARPAFASTGNIAPMREAYRTPPSFCGIPRLSPPHRPIMTTVYGRPCPPPKLCKTC